MVKKVMGFKLVDGLNKVMNLKGDKKLDTMVIIILVKK